MKEGRGEQERGRRDQREGRNEGRERDTGRKRGRKRGSEGEDWREPALIVCDSP
jgi:hypothetical protein